jgi:hypothetical protein
MSFGQDPKSGIKIFTHKEKLKKNDSLAICKPPAPCFTCLSIEVFIADKPKNIAHMHLSRKKSRKQKNDLNRGGEYWNFDEFSSQIRESRIQSYAEKLIAHAAGDGGICHQGFVKELVDKVAQVAHLLKITHKDITNKVRNIKAHANSGKFHRQFLTMQLTDQPFLPIRTQAFPLV